MTEKVISDRRVGRRSRQELEELLADIDKLTRTINKEMKQSKQVRPKLLPALKQCRTNRRRALRMLKTLPR